MFKIIEAFFQKVSPTYNLLKKIDSKLELLMEPIKKSMIEKKSIFPVYVDGMNMSFQDFTFSMTVDVVAKELGSGSYDFSDIDFKEGDVCIDIGANIGMVSIYLLKKFPFLKIIAFEPVKANYENLLVNLKLNGINEKSIKVYNLGVTKDGRNIDILTNTINSGTSTLDAINEYEHCDFLNKDINTITMQEIFRQHNLKMVKLLKIDCEGCEYEILYNTPVKILKSIDNIRGEFHDIRILKKQGYTIKKLEDFCKKHVKSIKVDHSKDY